MSPSTSGDRAAFFYGTLMSRKILHRVLYGTTTPDPYQRDRLTIKPAILYGYSRHKLRFADYPAIIPAPAPSSSSTLSPSNGNGDGQGEHGEAEAEAEGPTVLGTLVTGLGDHDVFRLDIFEGDEYERQMVTAYPLSMSYPGPKHSILNDLEGNGHGNGNGNGNENENGGRRGAKEQGMQVETYVWIEERKRLEDSEWDFEEFVREKMGRWVGEGVKNQDIEEVDEAVRALQRENEAIEARKGGHGEDPTGGRGIGKEKSKKLEDMQAGQEPLKSAV